MRLTSTQLHERALADLQARRNDLATTQSEISTGRRLVTPSSDPVAAAAAERARGQLARAERDARMAGFARSILETAEGALGDAGDVMLDARDTLLAARNGTLGTEDRTLLSQALRRSREQLLGIANRSDGSGGHVFGGQGGTGAPFSTSGSVVFTHAPGEQAVGEEVRATTALDGRALFTEIALPAGMPSDPSNPQTPSRNIFTTLDEAIALLEDPASSGTALNDGLGRAINGVDAATEAQLAARTRIGEQLHALDKFDTRLADDRLQANSRLADIVDVDLAESLSRLAQQQTGMDAALKSYAQVSQLSLFRYI